MKTRSTDFSGMAPLKLAFGSKTEGLKKTQVETPKKFDIRLQANPGKKTDVMVVGDNVQFSNPLTATYHLWQPPEGKAVTQPRRLWTKRYIGTDAAFYKAGYRWGVSLGGSPDDFKKSSLYLPGGRVNLPDGKYVVGIRADEAGHVEVVVGKEDRGVDQRVLADLKAGKKPEHNGRKEILSVANHSMLISRGQPYDPAKWNEDKFSAYFAGEVNVEDFKFNAINDQSGQFFGPNGLTGPTKPGQEPTDAEKFMKQPDYENLKTNALEFAKATLESITGQKDIHMVKVEFVRGAAPELELKLPRNTKIKASDTETLISCLKEAPIQALVDQFETEPEDQIRLLEALAKNGVKRDVILNLTQSMVRRETLKAEQAAKLALELFVTPQAVELFLPESPLFIPGVTDNTKRKLIAGYNKLELADEQPLSEFVKSLKGEHPILLQFFMGRRMAGGYVKLALSNMKDAAKAIFSTLSLFKFGDKPAGINGKNTTLAGDNPEFIWRLENAETKLKQLEKQLRDDSKNDSPVNEVVILNNPFDGKAPTGISTLKDNVQRLRALTEKGATLYRTDNTNIDRAVDYLTNLFAYSYSPKTADTELFQKEMQSLLTGYGVDIDELRSFAKDKFQGRWSNDQIVAAYAQEHKPFRTLLNDLVWFRDLPTVGRA